MELAHSFRDDLPTKHGDFNFNSYLKLPGSALYGLRKPDFSCSSTAGHAGLNFGEGEDAIVPSTPGAIYFNFLCG